MSNPSLSLRRSKYKEVGFFNNNNHSISPLRIDYSIAKISSKLKLLQDARPKMEYGNVNLSTADINIHENALLNPFSGKVFTYNFMHMRQIEACVDQVEKRHKDLVLSLQGKKRQAFKYHSTFLKLLVKTVLTFIKLLKKVRLKRKGKIHQPAQTYTKWQTIIVKSKPENPGSIALRKKISDDVKYKRTQDFITSEAICFNKRYFQRATSFHSFKKEVINMLSTDPKSRTRKEVEALAKYLRGTGLNCFSSYPDNILMIIARLAKYNSISSKYVIYRKSENPDHFFFLVKGNVQLTTLIQEGGNFIEKKISLLEPGAVLGEQEMVNYIPRKYNAKTVNNVVLLAIERNDILECFCNYDTNRYLPDYVKFLLRCKQIKEWPVEYLRNNLQHCFVYFYRRDSVIVEDNVKSDWLYIIKTGTCKVVKTMKKPQRRTIKCLYDRKKFPLNPSLLKSPLTERKKCKDKLNMSLPTVENKSEDQLSNNMEQWNTDNICVQIDSLQCHDVFGFDTLDFGDSHHIPTESIGLISSGAEVVLISKEMFVKNASTLVKCQIQNESKIYPQTTDISKKLVSQQIWRDYSKSVIADVIQNKKLNQKREKREIAF